MRKTELYLVAIVLAVMALVFCGCQEEQRAVWRQGELPTEFQSFFGNDNNARLNFVQTQTLNSHAQTLNKQANELAQLNDRIKYLESNNLPFLIEK